MTSFLRRMGRRFSLPAIVLLIALGVATPVAAEPIVVTGGFLQVHTRIPEGSFTLTGADFFMTGGYDGVFGSFSLECDFCESGTPVELDSQFEIRLSTGRAVVNGTTYPEVWFDGSFVAFDVPTARITGSESTFLVVPFTFHGLVRFLTVNPNVEPSDPVFTATLSGSGRAIAQFTYVPDLGVFNAESEIRYEFDAADPVPEPATLLLCGSGLAALRLIRKRRNHGA